MARGNGIEPASLQVLQLLTDMGSMSIHEVAEARDRSYPATRELLLGLIHRKLVSREREQWRKKKGRQYTVAPYGYSITAKGTRWLNKELARRDGSLLSAKATYGIRHW